MVEVTLSLPMKVALPVLVLGTVAFCVAFSTVSWAKLSVSGNGQSYDVQFGLWKVCFIETDLDSKVCYTWTSDQTDQSHMSRSWIHGAQALACLAVIFLAVALVFIFLHIFIFMQFRAAGIAAAVTCILASLFMMVASIYFGSKFNDDAQFSFLGGSLWWGFGFNIIGSILVLFAGVAVAFNMFLVIRSVKR